MNQSDFRAQHPDIFFLDLADFDLLYRYLAQMGWIQPAEELMGAEKAGDGNMNCTLRVITSQRKLILKQSRPWVEKYQHIAAPWDRALVEGAFYEHVASRASPVSNRMPGLLGIDKKSRVLALEDLGLAKDFTDLYFSGPLEPGELRSLAKYLAELHGADIPKDPVFLNREMRALNHEHIFRFPLLEENGLNLDSITPGLGEVASELRRNSAYIKEIGELGKVYLGDNGVSLLHGDFYPGSWLRTPQGVFVIDPEFCFVGPPEFDLGVMVAHLMFWMHSKRTPADVGGLTGELFALYGESGCSDFDRRLVVRFAGVEIMRRLIGVAQLPLRMSLGEKAELLGNSVKMVLTAVEGA